MVNNFKDNILKLNKIALPKLWYVKHEIKENIKFMLREKMLGLALLLLSSFFYDFYGWKTNKILY